MCEISARLVTHHVLLEGSGTKRQTMRHIVYVTVAAYLLMMHLKYVPRMYCCMDGNWYINRRKSDRKYQSTKSGWRDHF